MARPARDLLRPALRPAAAARLGRLGAAFQGVHGYALRGLCRDRLDGGAGLRPERGPGRGGGPPRAARVPAAHAGGALNRVLGQVDRLFRFDCVGCALRLRRRRRHRPALRRELARFAGLAADSGAELARLCGLPPALGFRRCLHVAARRAGDPFRGGALRAAGRAALPALSIAGRLQPDPVDVSLALVDVSGGGAAGGLPGLRTRAVARRRLAAGGALGASGGADGGAAGVRIRGARRAGVPRVSRREASFIRLSGRGRSAICSPTRSASCPARA